MRTVAEPRTHEQFYRGPVTGILKGIVHEDEAVRHEARSALHARTHPVFGSGCSLMVDAHALMLRDTPAYQRAVGYHDGMTIDQAREFIRDANKLAQTDNTRPALVALRVLTQVSPHGALTERDLARFAGLLQENHNAVRDKLEDANRALGAEERKKASKHDKPNVRGFEDVANEPARMAERQAEIQKLAANLLARIPR